MELKVFIENVIVEIAEGISIARDKVRKKLVISPANFEGENAVERDYINFDIAVTTSETEEKSGNLNKKGGLGIKVVSANINKNSKESKNIGSERITRVSFRVPVYHGAKYINEE